MSISRYYNEGAGFPGSELLEYRICFKTFQILFRFKFTQRKALWKKEKKYRGGAADEIAGSGLPPNFLFD